MKRSEETSTGAKEGEEEPQQQEEKEGLGWGRGEGGGGGRREEKRREEKRRRTRTRRTRRKKKGGEERGRGKQRRGGGGDGGYRFQSPDDEVLLVQVDAVQVKPPGLPAMFAHQPYRCHGLTLRCVTESTQEIPSWPFESSSPSAGIAAPAAPLTTNFVTSFKLVHLQAEAARSLDLLRRV